MRSMRQPLRGAAFVVAVALVTASCGDDDDQARTVDVTTSTMETEPAPAESGTAPATSTTAREAVPASSMDSVVITLQDLPTGWTASPPEAQAPQDEEFCEGQDPFDAVEPVEEAESAFEQGAFGPFLSSIAGRYASADDAQQVLDALAHAVDQCQTFTEIDDDGTETTYRFTALSFPNVGDDTYAARMSATTPVGPLALDFAFARQGQAVAGIINGGLGEADTALTESTLRLMVDRL